MKHVLSTHVFVNHRLTVAWLTRIQQIGIPAVEIFCARQHLDYRDKAQIAELGFGGRADPFGACATPGTIASTDGHSSGM